MAVRRNLIWIAVCVAGALALGSVADSRGFRRYLQLQQELKDLKARNDALRQQNDQFRREIEALRQDPAAVERAAREELGYVKQGEIVLNLE